MGICIREDVCKAIEEMDKHLRTELLKKDGRIQEEKLWENQFIKRQIEKRNENASFTLEDHICAMVYSLLSSNMTWDRVGKDVDPKTKRIISVDKIFCGYDTKELLKRTPEELTEDIKSIGCQGRDTLKQMKALLSVNISKLSAIEDEYGTIDTYYQKLIEIDASLKTLITTLSAAESKDKMAELGIPLVCEYLRNIGYDIPKPDRHIRRILGRDYLACSSEQEVPCFEAFDIVVKLAEMAGKSNAETDFILWSYCADGYGEICIKGKPKCEKCAVRQYCSHIS